MDLSKRLQTVADMIKAHGTVADIGTDHAYIPIYLILSGKMDDAIAMDVRKGPLFCARENIKAYQLEEKIQTRLSDGLEKLSDEEADTIVIAGMGGDLMARILGDGSHALRTEKELILQPQSNIDKVRRQLHAMEYRIDEEKMIVDNGKFYTVIRAVGGQETYEREVEYEYGRCLLERKDEVLWKFLQKELDSCKKIEKSLSAHQTENAKKRLEELKKEEWNIKEALSIYEMQTGC